MSSTSARNCISTTTVPSPWQVSQRPPGTLNEKCPAEYPRLCASGVPANKSRMPSNALIYVTGLDRGVRPIADWSTNTVARCSVSGAQGTEEPEQRDAADI